MKPIGVKIVTQNDLLTAGHPVPLRCDSWGSYPTAKITWLLDGEPIRNADVTTHSDRDVCIVWVKFILYSQKGTMTKFRLQIPRKFNYKTHLIILFVRFGAKCFPFSEIKLISYNLI